MDANIQKSPGQAEKPLRDTEKGEGGFRLGQMKKPQRRRFWASVFSVVLVGLLYLGVVCSWLLTDKQSMRERWAERVAVSDALAARHDELIRDAVQVTCGTYVDHFKNISLRESSFQAVVLVWFRWQGSPELDMKNHFRFYSGTVNGMQTVADQRLPDGGNYQQVRVDVTVTKTFADDCFPLDSHQLVLYLESDLPIDRVRLRADESNSGVNDFLETFGYRVTRSYVQEYCFQYGGTFGNPALSQPDMASEVATVVEIVRAELGSYFKCFIALLGTTLWMFITLFVCTYHRVNPLEMVPAALFGAVGNLMVGASILPDSLNFGLLEYVNVWGVMSVLAITLCIISINRIRAKEKDHAFANYYGKVMFFLLVCVVTLGHAAMPLAAYFG